MQTITDLAHLESLDRIVCRAAGALAANPLRPFTGAHEAAVLLMQHDARTADIRPLPLLVAARGHGILDG